VLQEYLLTTQRGGESKEGTRKKEKKGIGIKGRKK
jgi:hypothetical protein